MYLIIGAILGFISVAFGAYAEHGLKEKVSDEYFRFLMTAIRYNQIYAIIICSLGLSFLSIEKISNNKFIKISSILFIIGTILFSFSIYFGVILNERSIFNITPIGGITLMLAWLFLAYGGLKVIKK